MKRYLSSILILLVLVGLFGPVKVEAQNPPDDPNEMGMCSPPQGNPFASKRSDCGPMSTFRPNNQVVPPTTPAPKTGDAFRDAIDDGCGVSPTTWFNGCLLKVIYYTYFQLPSWLLWVSAYFFDAMINLGIQSYLTSSSGFIPAAWAVVRDLSNIFFILVLLYIAIQTILGMGHETKKMIVKVVILALLINFSMFFTKIVIDSSNILALVFYNKLTIKQDRPLDPAFLPEVKDISGEMWKTFDATKLIDQDTITQLKSTTIIVNGQTVIQKEEKLPFGLTFGIMVIAGTIMLFAAYVFFFTGVMFIGRMIELWILIIFSPFAFMSYTIPQLSSVEYLGWNDWLKRLISTAFMAPIFMFFIYLIFMLLPHISKITGTDNRRTLIGTILTILVPALVVLAMLLKAKDFAKKGGGQFGEMAVTGMKLATGLAIGAATGGAALAGRAAIGSTAKFVQNNVARGKALQLKTNLKDNFKSKWSYVNPAAYARSASVAGKFATARVAQSLHTAGIGDKMKKADEGYEHKTHATHILDAKMKSEYGHQPGYENAKYKDLTEVQQGIVKTEVNKDEIAKFIYGKLFKDLEAPDAQKVKDLDIAGNKAIDDGHGKTIGYGTALNDVHDSNGAPKTVTDPNTGGQVPMVGKQFKADYFVEKSGAPAAMGEFVQALRKGSYDIRNLPDMSAKSKGFPKIGVGTVALIAAGIRLGMKKGGGVEYGTPKGDFMGDMGNTITEALKNVKINVSSGGHGGEDSHTKEVKSVGH